MSRLAYTLHLDRRRLELAEYDCERLDFATIRLHFNSDAEMFAFDPDDAFAGAYGREVSGQSEYSLWNLANPATQVRVVGRSFEVSLGREHT